MQQMNFVYAQRLLDGGRAFNSRFLSKTDTLLVCIYDPDDYPYRKSYYIGTKLKDGKLIIDKKGMVTFTKVDPIIDETTKWYDLP